MLTRRSTYQMTMLAQRVVFVWRVMIPIAQTIDDNTIWTNQPFRKTPRQNRVAFSIQKLAMDAYSGNAFCLLIVSNSAPVWLCHNSSSPFSCDKCTVYRINGNTIQGR